MNIDFYLYCYRAILSCCMFGTPTIFFVCRFMWHILHTVMLHQRNVYQKFQYNKNSRKQHSVIRQSEFMVCAEDYSLFIRLDWLFWGMRFKKKEACEIGSMFWCLYIGHNISILFKSYNYWLKYTNSYNTRQ